MQQRTRRLLLALVALAALAAPERPALTADAPSPPGLDAFSERLLKGLRLRVGTRAAATAPDGTLHVVYGGSQLRHAWNPGDGWQTETLDATHGRGIGAALAFDAAGDLHVAYGDLLRGELFHGEKSGTQWTSRLVAQGLRAGDPEPAVAVSGDGVVHVAWLDDYEKTVRYAQDASGSFAATTLAGDGGYGCDLDLTLAPDGTPHVVFMSTAVSTSGSLPRALVHMERTAGGWTREDVESANDFGAAAVGAAASCAFAPDGELHAFYLGAIATYGEPRPLRHARRTAGGWQTESVGTFANNVDHTHAVADAAGVLHVGIVGWSTNGTAGRLAVGTWGDWSVASAPEIPQTAAFALATDALHFTFADGSAIAVQRWDRTTQETAKTTLDRASEPLQRPSIATDAAGRARIAIVREDVGGARVEVFRSDGSAWQLEVAASGPLTSVAPSLRVGPGGSLSVAYARPGGTLSCASDAGGTWTSVDAVTGLGASSKRVAHAVAPDGTRRVAWTEVGVTTLRLATEGAGGWTVSTLAELPQTWSALPLDVEVTSDGVTHVVWLHYTEIRHSYEDGGSWTTETVGSADGGWEAVPALDLVQSPQGDLWISFSVPWQFYNFADAYTNRGGTWSFMGLGSGDDVALGFLPDGAVRGVGTSWGVTRYGDGEMQGKQELIDAGPGKARQFALAQSNLTEGGAPIRLGVVTGPPPNGWRVAKFAGAVDAAGACHAAYVDSATGDLRYATDRDPGRPATASVEIVRGPDSAGVADASFTPSVVRFGDDDSGTKFVTVSIAQDDVYEPEEKLVLDLVNPAGVALGTVARHTVRLIDDETTPPPPPPPPPPVQDPDYFLPTKARIAVDSSVRAHGVLHLADPALEPQSPLVLAWGDRELTIPTLRRHRDGLLTWSDGGAKLSLRPERGSAGRYRFDLRLPPAEPSTSGPLAVRLEFGEAAPSSSVYFVRGKLDLSRGEGWFEDPPLHLESLRATDGAPGSLELSALLQGLGGVTDTAPRAWITVGEVFAREISPAEFRREDAQWVAASRDAHVTVDHRRGRVSARFDDANVFLPPEGVSALDVLVRVQFGKRDVVRTLSTPVTRKGRKLRI